jgi:hypothetical protein
MLAVFGASTAVAFAQAYEPAVGGEVVIRSTNVSGTCTPNTDIRIAIQPPGTIIGHATSDSDGNFSATVAIPEGSSSAATLVATDASGTCVLSAVATRPQALAFSGGSNSTRMVLAIGVVIVAIGIVFIVTGRRARRSQVHAR